LWGYRGGYSAVTDFIRAWRENTSKSPSKAFVPLSFELGEAFQFDWSVEGLMVGGVFYKVQVSHLKLWQKSKIDPYRKAFSAYLDSSS
jgi:hypothetical protein